MLVKLALAFAVGACVAGALVYITMQKAEAPVAPPAPLMASIARPALEMTPVTPPKPVERAVTPKPKAKAAVAATAAVPAPVEEPKPAESAKIWDPEKMLPREEEKPKVELLKPDPITPPAVREARRVRLAAGSTLTVRLSERLTSDNVVAGDSFSGTLDAPLVLEGFVVAERGSRVQGRVVSAARSERGKGNATLAIELTELMTADNQRIALSTETFLAEGSRSKGGDVAKVGAGAAIGAALGAIFGGGQGAAIGAAAGGAAGAGTVFATRGKAAVLDIETRIPFRVRKETVITENLSAKL